MKLGLYLRNMGPASAPATIHECARAAEAAGIDDLWVADHIAIPREESEGSGGRYLDPLATLAYLAGVTKRINLGVGVLVLPYRPPLATAKWIATIQELSGGRLLLGVGAGWMEAEFRAVGIAKSKRGRITDATLTFLEQCFSSDEVELNGQKFLFLPRPRRPPIFVGGSPPHALRRTLRFGDGWMPMGMTAEQLRRYVEQLRKDAAAANKQPPEIAVLTSLPLSDPAAAASAAREYAEIGATRIAHAWRYSDATEFTRAAKALSDHVRPALV
jgi:probable F420-dependent oxidoreductase